jgi:hypothetical protein
VIPEAGDRSARRVALAAASLVLVVSGAGCGSRASPAAEHGDAGDADPDSDAGTDFDVGGDPAIDSDTDGEVAEGDAVGGCFEGGLAAGIAVGTDRRPAPDAPDDTFIQGVVSYVGPVREPLATDPAFDHEVALAHDDGRESIVQYYLPYRIELPVEVGGHYVLVWRQATRLYGTARGLVVQRASSGVYPLLFVADLGGGGRAFQPSDPLFSPMLVTGFPDPACQPRTNMDPCCYTWEQEVLRFGASPWGKGLHVDVPQGGQGELQVLGNEFTAVNLGSKNCSDATCGPVAGETYLIAIRR